MATVKKKLPYELYDVAGLEDWFSQMAAEGLHLEECRQDKARFTVGEPRENVRYRLEAQQTYQYDWNKDREYAEQGWHHVTTIIGFFYIFRCDDPAIEELHTDPTIQSWTMKKLIRRQWFLLLYYPLYWAFMRRTQLGRLFGTPMEVAKSLILQDVLMLLETVMVLGLVYLFAKQAVQLTMLRRLKKRLAPGLPMDRSKRYPRSFWLHGFGWVLTGVILAGFIGCFMLMDRLPEQIDPADYPHVSLDEVLSQPHYYAEELPFTIGAKLGSSLLVPVQFEYGDAGVLDDGGWNRVRVYLYYYETVSPTAADILLKGSIQELRRDLEEDRDWHEKYPELFNEQVLDTGAVPSKHDRLDTLLVYDYQYRNSEQHRVYFARMGSKVLVLYTMLPEPEAALELMIAKMEGRP